MHLEMQKLLPDQLPSIFENALRKYNSLASHYENSIFTSKKEELVKEIALELKDALVDPFLDLACESIKQKFKIELDGLIKGQSIAKAYYNFVSTV
eukprot:GHVP01024530.1.p1 GENE.GHVP01024530.1~~GHVP01024530.1.p1  ORF type:complete len:106 (-),score=25.77 GHVP01024530.1:184-471(-)